MFFHLINEKLEKHLRAYGFMRREPTRFLLVGPHRTSDDVRQHLLSPSGWLITMGDSDIDRPWEADGARLQAHVVRCLGKVVEAEVGLRLVYGHRREIQVLGHEPRDEVSLLLRRHAQLEPVAGAASRQHEVIGRADLACGELLGDEARRQVIGHAGAAVFFLKHERAEPELGKPPANVLGDEEHECLDLLRRRVELRSQFRPLGRAAADSDTASEPDTSTAAM